MKKPGPWNPRLLITEDDYKIKDLGYDTLCWIPYSKKGNGRYGLVRINRQETYFHIAMYRQKVGPIPRGMQLDHLCLQTRCINPEHLEPVTPIENTRRGKATKLTLNQAQEIRESRLTAVKLAEQFGVSWSLIYRIKKGDRWHQD